MSTLTAALLQLHRPYLSPDEAMHRGEDACRQAKQLGADIAVFPEMWNIGYAPPFAEAMVEPMRPGFERDREKWRRYAITSTDDFIQHFCRLAKELDMAICLTYLERYPEKPRNSASLIDRHGNIVLTYAKVHTCDFSMEALLTPGDAFRVCSLDTSEGLVNVGIMICYDREFPESARTLMLGGAELVLVPNACDMNALRLQQLSTRAFENMLDIAMTNYAGDDFGQSAAFHGMAFDADGRVQDLSVARATQQEEIVLAQFDIAKLRAYRHRETWGNAYRKPYAYTNIVANEVLTPFIREDSRRNRPN